MYRLRSQFLLASAALVGLSIPSAVLAHDNKPDEQQSTVNSKSTQDRSDEQSQQSDQSARENTEQNDQQHNANSVTGQVDSYREVNIDGTEHFRARLKTTGGSMQTVDFGPSDRSSDLIDNIEEGDHITVQGQVQKVNGKPVLEADQARLAGKTYQIAEAQKADESQGREADRSEPANAEASAQPSEQQPNSQQKENQQQPKEVVMLNERFVFLDEGDLNRHLILAKEALRMGDNHAAAGELLVSAERLSLYTNGQGNKKSTEDLNSARQDLKQLAERINKNQSVKPEEIDQAASSAQAAMAALFADRVQSERGTEKSIEAGYDLQSAAIHAREALLWSDQNVPDDTAHSIHQALKTADGLISGNNQSTQQADQVEQTLCKTIDQVDQKQQSEAQPAAAQMPAKENQKTNQKPGSGQEPQTSKNSGSSNTRSG